MNEAASSELRVERRAVSCRATSWKSFEKRKRIWEDEEGSNCDSEAANWPQASGGKSLPCLEVLRC